MKEFVCIALIATLALASAKPQYGQGAPPSGPWNSAPAPPPSNGPWNSGPPSGGDSGYYPNPNTPPATATQTITKHVYVHVAPPEHDVPRPPQQFPTPVGQKHYKIIFVKAPTYNPPPPPQIPPQAQNEEKTLVYVLVKKPEDAPEINIPTVAPTQPSKPEVYFIKYKTQKEQGSSQKYGAPAAPPQSNYGAPSAPSAPPSSSYGAPSAPPSNSYGAPGRF